MLGLTPVPLLVLEFCNVLAWCHEGGGAYRGPVEHFYSTEPKVQSAGAELPRKMSTR
jgi:hypothetical protein